MSTPNATKRYVFLLAGVLLAVVAAILLYKTPWIKPGPAKPPPDMVAVLRLNAEGVGIMERFEKYDTAASKFEQAVNLAPDWLPGRVNLGIALMNVANDEKGSPQGKADTLKRAEDIFTGLLKESESYQTYAHFCLGLIIIHYRANPDDFGKAKSHFEAVTKLDPNDAYSWFWLAQSVRDDDRETALKCYQRAVELNPYFNSALNGLHTELRLAGKEKEAEAILERTEALRRTAIWYDQVDPKYYSNFGKYALVIGHAPDHATTPRSAPLPLFVRDDKLQVQLAPGARWATSADFGMGTNADLFRKLRERFGAVMVTLDYNRDGKPDLLILAAVVENGNVRDVLLRNDGDSHFTDVSAEAGLITGRPSIGCTVADFDNDGLPDLFLTGIGNQRLLRNNNGKFADVTKEAKLDSLKSVCLSACFIDLDQDGDLDLVVAQYADSAEHALAMLNGGKPEGALGLALFINAGEAPANNNQDPAPLKPDFRRMEHPAFGGDSRPAVALTASDLDLDYDVDLLVLADGKPPAVVVNDRLLRFHRDALPAAVAEPGRWNGALVLDVNHDERSDLLLVGPGKMPALLVHKQTVPGSSAEKWFENVPVHSPALLHAQAIDIDLDGWTDVVGLSEAHKPVLLRGDGQKLIHAVEAFGPDANWPKDLAAVLIADVDCDGWPDLVVWSESQGLQVQTNRGNGNHGLKLELAGHRRVEPAGFIVRCNADGFGARLSALSGTHWTGLEFTTLSAGLGQSRQPIQLGLADQTQIDVLRLLWPDNCIQAEFNEAPASPCHVRRLGESNRKQTSCPILFTWNGQRFVFVTDFLGAGTLGEMLPGGVTNTPRPEESVKIEPEQLQPRDGKFILKFAEPMDEITYLDRLQLVVVDHPADMSIYPDERFVANGPNASQELLAFRHRISPVNAKDHRGKDVTAKLRSWDRETVNDFKTRAWIGFAEEHWVELDFGDRLAKFGLKDRLFLCLAGWTDYPYPESIWAANQAGIESIAPILERLDDNGKWQPVAEIGFPAGLPRMMTFEVTGKLVGPRCKVRLRTNMHVFWDQIFVAPLQPMSNAHGTTVEVSQASLYPRGCMLEFSPDGKAPTIYDYDRIDAVPVSRLSGRMTRFGDVTELLRDTDDRFVIFGPGDELSVEFDAKRLPPLPGGWKRSYVLQTSGYCKDCAPFTATGETVEPLPFRAMTKYPYGTEESYPRDALHEDYQKNFNTRGVGTRGR